VFFAALCAATSAAAQDAAQASAERVSIGAGIGFSGGALGGLGALGALSTQPVTPVGTALIELRASEHLRIVFSASGSYRRGKSLMFTEAPLPLEGDAGAVERTPTRSSLWSYGARTGLRWVVNPGGVVEVSPLLTLGYSRYRSKDQLSDSEPRGDRSQRSSVFDAQLGLVFERRLMEQLYLRLASSVLQLSRSHTRSDSHTDGGLSTLRDDESTSVGLAFSPSIELRLTF
jgi:Outer membrane protein beta-barrel domain